MSCRQFARWYSAYTSLAQVSAAEINLIAQLEKFKGLVEEAGQFKTSLAKIAKAIKPAKKRAKRTKKAKARPDPAHARQPDARRGADTERGIFENGES